MRSVCPDRAPCNSHYRHVGLPRCERQDGVVVCMEVKCHHIALVAKRGRILFDLLCDIFVDTLNNLPDRFCFRL